MNKKSGFTTVEFMICVVIAGLLAAMAIPVVRKIRENEQQRNDTIAVRVEQTNQDWELVAKIKTPSTTIQELRHRKTGIHYLFYYSGGFIMLMDAEGKPYRD